MKIEISDIEVIEVSLEEIKIVKSILNKDKDTINCIKRKIKFIGSTRG